MVKERDVIMPNHTVQAAFMLVVAAVNPVERSGKVSKWSIILPKVPTWITSSLKMGSISSQRPPNRLQLTPPHNRVVKATATVLQVLRSPIRASMCLRRLIRVKCKEQFKPSMALQLNRWMPSCSLRSSASTKAAITLSTTRALANNLPSATPPSKHLSFEIQQRHLHQDLRI